MYRVVGDIYSPTLPRDTGCGKSADTVRICRDRCDVFDVFRKGKAISGLKKLRQHGN